MKLNSKTATRTEKWLNGGEHLALRSLKRLRTTVFQSTSIWTARVPTASIADEMNSSFEPLGGPR